MTTEFKPRSAWTSAPRGGAQLTGTKLIGVACHWPGTTTDAYGVETEAKVASRLRGWWDYHVNTRGWTDIGYNFAVDQAGRAWDLRGLTRVGAHCASASNPDANHEWLGVLFILGDEERPSAAMIRAFQDLRFQVILDRWPGRTRLTGHGLAPGVPGAQTSCPGPFVAAKITDGTLAQPGITTPPPEDDMELTDTLSLSAGTKALIGADTVSVDNAMENGLVAGVNSTTILEELGKINTKLDSLPTTPEGLAALVASAVADELAQRLES